MTTRVANQKERIKVHFHFPQPSWSADSPLTLYGIREHDHIPDDFFEEHSCSFHLGEWQEKWMKPYKTITHADPSTSCRTGEKETEEGTIVSVWERRTGAKEHPLSCRSQEFLRAPTERYAHAAKEAREDIAFHPAAIRRETPAVLAESLITNKNT